jgi:hypothetical protein
MQQTETLLAERERVCQQRQELMQRISIASGAAGMEGLAAIASAPLSVALRQRKTHLRALAQDLAQQTQSASFLARHHLDFFQSFFRDLTQSSQAGSRYGPEGQLQSAAPQSLLQAQG